MIHKFSFLLLLPAIVLHELTHAAASYPWANKIEIDLWPEARVYRYYSADVPRWVYRVTNLAPTIIGTILAITLTCLYPTMLFEVWPPTGIYLFGLWVQYTAPSHADMFPFEYIKSNK